MSLLPVARFRSAVGPTPQRPNAAIAHPSAGYVRIPLSAITSDDASFYVLRTDGGTPIRFLIYRDLGRNYHAAIDGSKCCYAAGEGYAQSGRTLICRHCGVGCATAMDEPQPRGCYPVPIPVIQQEDRILISSSDVQKLHDRLSQQPSIVVSELIGTKHAH